MSARSGQAVPPLPLSVEGAAAGPVRRWPVGAHLGLSDTDSPDAVRAALAAVADAGQDIVQINLGSPQSWQAPTFPGGDPTVLRDAAAEIGIGIYVHAPYLINVATTNNRVRIPSRSQLAKNVAAADAIGARGVVVHGGHLTDDDDPAVGVTNWRKALDAVEMTVPILIENTAGGGNAMARTLESIARLWEGVGDTGVGFCLDTCHAWAAGIALPDAAEQVLAITGRIDLVHVNNSRDAFASSRDRHAALAHGEIAVDDIVATVLACRAPALLETPGETIGEDMAILRKALPDVKAA